MQIEVKNKNAAQHIYMILAGLFITALVVSNLIFQKFFYWYPFDISLFDVKLFELSVGILPYPITFLITDTISEIYGKKKANDVIVVGLFASFFSLFIIWITSSAPATDWSPVNDSTYQLVFGNTGVAVLASMLAYLIAQYVDVQVYHFWKSLTKGKHLWLRNNFSTFTSQWVDTTTILILLCSFHVIDWALFPGLLISGVIFKMLVALIDTPFLYLIVYAMRNYFGLAPNEEILLD